MCQASLLKMLQIQMNETENSLALMNLLAKCGGGDEEKMIDSISYSCSSKCVL